MSLALGGDGNLDRVQRDGALERRRWRVAVFERDDYTCRDCGAKSVAGLAVPVVLNADHIKPWSEFPELRFDVSNGRTLCVPCHKKTPTYGNRQRKIMMAKKSPNTFNVFYDI